MVDAVAVARERIRRDADALHPHPTPGRAKAVTTKVVDDVIRVMDGNSDATKKQQIDALVRLGKFAKHAAYRNSLAAAMALRESAIVTALAAGVLYGSASTKNSVKKLQTMIDDGDIVAPFLLAIWALLSSYVVFYSIVTLLKKAVRGLRKVVLDGTAPWS